MFEKVLYWAISNEAPKCLHIWRTLNDYPLWSTIQIANGIGKGVPFYSFMSKGEDIV